MKKDKERGWVCPLCKKVHAPSVKECNCNLKERNDKVTEEKLLTE